MTLTILIIIPLLTCLLILFNSDLKKIRTVALSGAILQMVYAFSLLWQYLHPTGEAGPLFMEFDRIWFLPLNIHYHIGVDGIALSMILLTSLIVVAGILMSWTMEKMPREYFFLLVMLSMGAYGFFISQDLFTMFFFLEVAVIPKFLLIGIWGSGNKIRSAMKLALMLMAGSALVFLGMVGMYCLLYTSDAADE